MKLVEVTLNCSGDSLPFLIFQKKKWSHWWSIIVLPASEYFYQPESSYSHIPSGKMDLVVFVEFSSKTVLVLSGAKAFTYSSDRAPLQSDTFQEHPKQPFPIISTQVDYINS